MTTAEKVVVTSEVEILDELHAPVFSYVRTLLEEPDPYDEKDDAGWMARGKDPPERRTASGAVSRAGAVVRETAVIAPGEETHEKFNAHLGYDAPLHHTDLPTIPSVLHLACHQIHSDENISKHLLKVDNVTYHAPLKPNQRCKCTIHSDLDGGKDSYISILRAMDGSGNEKRVLSSVLFRTNAILDDVQMLPDAP